MFAHRILKMRPVTGPVLIPHAHIRAFSLARIALAPPKKLPPPPPPASKPKKLVASAKLTTAPTTKAKAVPPPAKGSKAAPAKIPVTLNKRARPVEKPKAKASAPKPKLRLAVAVPKLNLREKARIAKAKELERMKTLKTKEQAKKREQLALAKVRKQERAKAARVKQREKASRARARAKEQEKRVKTRERERIRKEQAKQREKLKAERAKKLEKPYPPPPKRPPTGYIMFSHDPNVKRKKGVGVVEDALVASQAWKALSDQEREVYNQKAKKLTDQWRSDVTKWVSSLNLAQLTAARANREPGTRDESALVTLPLRPGNAYAMFLADLTSRQDFRDKVEALAKKEAGGDDTKLKKVRIGLFGRSTSDMWKTMSEKEKAVYFNRAADAKKQWDKNFGTLVAAQKQEFRATL